MDFAFNTAPFDWGGTAIWQGSNTGGDHLGKTTIVTVGDENEVLTVTGIVDIVPTLYGEAASYADVKNLFLFDLIIGNLIYSWKRKDGFKHMGLDGGKIGLVKYRPVHVNGGLLGHTKKTIVPSLVSSPPLEIVDGYISMNGSSYADTPFFDISTRSESTLGEIKRIAPDGEIYPIICKEREDVEEII